MKQIGTTVLALLAVVAVCHAQTLTISGIVKNSKGNSIKGVMVRLGKADLMTTTRRDGSFTLQGTINTEQKEMAPAKMTTTAVRIDDALLFTKDGYQLYRLAVKNPDTSNIRITMTPFVTGSVRDIDGNAYQTVRYGNQEWTVENLKTTKYNDSTAITHIPDSATWCNIYLTVSTTPAYCIYGANTTSKAKYGVFYNWYAVNTGKLAPKGWRIPTHADWDTLQNYLIRNGYNYDGTTSGNKIAKSMATQRDWDSSTLDGAIGNDLNKNNASGFSALPGGLRHWGGSYYSLFLERTLTYLWSSTEYDSLRAWHCHIDCHKNYLDRNIHNKNTGFPVRIVRDVN